MRRCKEEIISQQDIIESKKSRGRQSVPAQSQASAGCAAAQNVRCAEFVAASVIRECPDTDIADYSALNCAKYKSIPDTRCAECKLLQIYIDYSTFEITSIIVSNR